MDRWVYFVFQIKGDLDARGMALHYLIAGWYVDFILILTALLYQVFHHIELLSTKVTTKYDSFRMLYKLLPISLVSDKCVKVSLHTISKGVNISEMHILRLHFSTWSGILCSMGSAYICEIPMVMWLINMRSFNMRIFLTDI